MSEPTCPIHIPAESMAAMRVIETPFHGVVDRVLAWGFNFDEHGRPVNVSEVRVNEQIEYDYYDGVSHWIEKNFDYELGGLRRRFAMFRTYRDNPDVMTEHTINVAGTGGFNVDGPSNVDFAGERLFRVDSGGHAITKTGYYFPDGRGGHIPAIEVDALKQQAVLGKRGHTTRFDGPVAFTDGYNGQLNVGANTLVIRDGRIMEVKHR